MGRIGRITPWLKVAHLAECYNVLVAPHFLMEIHPPLACAVPTGAHLEYIPQLGSITVSNVVIADGYAYPPTAPGIRLEWDCDRSPFSPPALWRSGLGTERHTSVVRLKPDMEAQYRRLHAEVWPGVLETLRRANVHNY